MKRFSQTLKVVLALFVAVFSNGLLPAVQASAYNTNPNANYYSKVYVCKYVGTPGVNETLQTGNNPISVSKNAISNFNGLGSYFNDAQGRSYVVAWDNGDHQEPPISMCPTPTTSIPVPATPAVTDPCGSNNAAWVVPADTAQIDWTLKQNGDLVADTKAGYKFNDQTTTHNYGKAVDSNVACVVSIPVPATPSVTDPCGSNNATWIVPADTAQIDWVLEANGDLVANAKTGYEFATGNKTSHNYGKAVDSNVACVVSIPVPATPSKTDPCGLNNAAWVKPANTASVSWTIVNGHLIATANSGYIFNDQTSTHDYGVAIDSGVLCIVTIPVPDKPGTKDPCGLHNAEWIVPHDTQQIDWSVNYKGELIATAKHGYIFANEQQSYNFGKAIDSGVLCQVTPKTPKFVDYCGTQPDYVIIPDVRGVIYKIDGKVVKDGYHKVSGSVTVTAVPDDDYVFDEEATSTWTHTFLNFACITITKSALPVTDTNKDGAISVGDIITWKITVTNNSTNKVENFRVQVEDATATLENDGLIKNLEAGESVTLTATSTLTASDLKACKATNVAEFFAWYNRDHHSHHTHNERGIDTFSMTYDDEDEYDLSGSASADAAFTCPTPGSGGNTTPETPVATPASIPATGSDPVGSPLLTLAAAVIAYGATFFLQQRRNLTTQASTK